MSKRIRRGLLCAVMLAGACSRDLSILAPTGELSLTVPGKHDDHSSIIALALAGTNSCDVVSRRPTDPPEKARKTRVVLALPAQLAGRKRVRTVDPVEEGQVVESKAPIGVARLVRWDRATGAKILDASCAIPATKEAVAFTRRYLSSAANDLGVSQGSNLRVQPGYSNLIETMQCWYDPAEDSVDCGGVTCARVYAQLRTASIVGSSSIMSNLGDGDVFLCANDCVVANWATISCGGGSGVFGGPVDGGGGGSTMNALCISWTATTRSIGSEKRLQTVRCTTTHGTRCDMRTSWRCWRAISEVVVRSCGDPLTKAKTVQRSRPPKVAWIGTTTMSELQSAPIGKAGSTTRSSSW